MTSKIRTLSIYIESNSLQKLRVSEVMIYQDCKTPKKHFKRSRQHIISSFHSMGLGKKLL